MEQDAIVRIIYHMKKYTKKRKAKRKAKKGGKGKKGKGKGNVVAKVAAAAKALGGGDTPHPAGAQLSRSCPSSQEGSRRVGQAWQCRAGFVAGCRGRFRHENRGCYHDSSIGGLLHHLPKQPGVCAVHLRFDWQTQGCDGGASITECIPWAPALLWTLRDRIAGS